MFISNTEFLQTIFGANLYRVHVTSFHEDPNDILPSGNNRARCWSGNWFNAGKLIPFSNQYFTVSLFSLDPKDTVPRRRGVLFESTHVIVLDDVKEKLPLDRVNLLPTPTYKLRTSQFSEQWGYVLSIPCRSRDMVDNLLDGLVTQGLAPDGKDPGMRGVTRYVRLPEGLNTKKSRYVNGAPFRCQLVEWNPDTKVSLKDLATPFGIDVLAPRKGMKYGDTASVDHPVFLVDDLLSINFEKSPGVYDVTCPWIEEHTDGVNNGAAIFTNEDLTLGFKCHHGHCQHRTAKELLAWCEDASPGFKSQLQTWKMAKEFAKITVAPEPETGSPFWDSLTALANMHYTDLARLTLAGTLVKQSLELDSVHRVEIHNELKRVMGWSAPQLKAVINDIQAAAVQASASTGMPSFLGDLVYIGDIKRFYHTKKYSYHDLEGLEYFYKDKLSNVKDVALDGTVCKVDRLDFRPGKPQIFKEGAVEYLNTWRENRLRTGVQGDISHWVNHFRKLGWGDCVDHVMDWMAYTVQRPENKINHMLVFGGREGTGKDFLLEPLRWIMGEYAQTTDAEEILSTYGDFLPRTKHLHINEADPTNTYEAKKMHNKLKPFAVSPPDTFRLKQRYRDTIDIQNIVNCTLATNHRNFVCLEEVSNRYFFLWTDVRPTNADGDLSTDWNQYWTTVWDWMLTGGGREAVGHMLQTRDVSHFNHKMRAPATPWLRDLVQESRDELDLAIEHLMKKKEGCFKHDIVSVQDVLETIKRASLFLSVDIKNIRRSRIESVLVAYRGTERRDIKLNLHTERLYIIRNHHQLLQYSDADFINHYENNNLLPDFKGKDRFILIPGGVK